MSKFSYANLPVSLMEKASNCLNGCRVADGKNPSNKKEPAYAGSLLSFSDYADRPLA